MLTLTERLFLLSIDDDKGKIASFASEPLKYGLAGALLAELALLNKIRIQKKGVQLLDHTETDEALLNEALAQIGRSKRERKPTYWIETFASRKLNQAVAERLVKKNIIRIEEKRYLWVIPYQVYPEVDASAKYWIKQRLRSIVLAGEKPEPDQIMLLSLLKACDLLYLVFTREERKLANKVVKNLVREEVIGEAVASVIAAIDAAIATVVIVAASSSSS